MQSLNWFTYMAVAAQVAVIVAAIWMFYVRFIRGTSSEKFVRGLFGLAALWVISWILIELRLNILGLFIRWVAIFFSVGLIVIFQPELRKFLGMMGHVSFLRALISRRVMDDATRRDKLDRAADEITKAADYMSKRRTGALIVFQKDLIGTVEKVGTKLNADVSSELLMTIFFNKTPLHDGAVIIYGDQILSAGAILPLTENSNLNWKYGTRHRAAIGMSEQSDATVLVVSEETGTISIVQNGTIKKFDDMKKLRAKIREAVGK